MTTAPRLWTLLPELTVQRVRWSAGAAVADCRLWVTRSPPRGQRREVAFVAPPELGAALPDRVLERVAEGGRRGRDDVRVGAHGRPLERAVGRLDRDPGLRSRGRTRVEDPDLVVVQVDAV